MVVGQNIRRLRLRRGLTQVELAKLIGTEQTVISSYEVGRVTVTLPRLQAIAEALQAEPGEFFKESEAPPEAE